MMIGCFKLVCLLCTVAVLYAGAGNGKCAIMVLLIYQYFYLFTSIIFVGELDLLIIICRSCMPWTPSRHFVPLGQFG